jgi:hypothetical protein
MNGTDPKRCRSHLGRRPELVKAEWDARQRGERIRAEYDLPAQSDPLNELLRLAKEVLTWMWGRPPTKARPVILRVILPPMYLDASACSERDGGPLGTVAPEHDSAPRCT